MHSLPIFKYLIIVIVIICPLGAPIDAQNNPLKLTLSGGMGVNYTYSASVYDHLLKLPYDQPSKFHTSLDFFTEASLPVSEQYMLSLQYGYRLYSFNASNANYEFVYNIHKLTLLADYFVPGQGYFFKLGAGMGPRFIKVSEKIFVVKPNEYQTSGIGLLARAEGNTLLGDGVYLLIGGDVEYIMTGKFKTVTNDEMGLNSFSIGLKLGISYSF